MASFTIIITATEFCSPNEGHLTLTASGDVSATRRGFELRELRQNVTSEQAGEAALVLARWNCRNLTNAQAKAAVAAGITISGVSVP